ncbi:MAG: ABC transporter permease subunit [Alicyclobacillus sp.]|nr:ABC transporter permease subunit [Alicyclobacillus sp.]
MASNRGFWQLVRHDSKLRPNRRRPLPRRWRVAYGVVVAIVVLVVTTYESAHNRVPITALNSAWFITFYFPIVAFGFGAGVTAHEWRQNTVGWWLTLPVSRSWLVGAKVLAAWLKSSRLFLYVYAIGAVLGLYSIFLSTHALSGSAVGPFLLTGLWWNGVLLLVSPATTAFGVLFSTLRYSQLRPALPIVWIVIGGGWWLLSSHLKVAASFVPSITSSPAATPHWPWMFCAVAASWVLALLFTGIASLVLREQVNL